jgi:Type IV secretion-system coupling protein DNA-binding domain
MTLPSVSTAASVLSLAGRHDPARTPLARFLTHPAQAVHHLAHLLLAHLAGQGPAAGLATAAAAAAVIAGRAWLRRRQHAALTAAARTITVLAPPQASPAGGEALWGNLAGLMRPPWARLWHGQPPIGWEYAWTAAGMTITVWVPGTVPPAMIERAIEAAWPGTHTITAPATAPLPPGGLATGGTLRLARPEILPLKTDHDTDPLRALAAAGTALAGGEHAIVQLLARPATGSRLRRARRATRRLRYGQPARLSSQLLDALTPGRQAAPRRTAARADPELAADLRAATAKAAGPQWETQIRYAVTTTTAIPGTGRARRAAATAQARRRLRGLAHALASATALYAGRNWLARRPLPSPATQITARRFRRGDLLSVPELACLARLPADALVPGLARAGARAVPPPPAIPAPGPHARPLGVTDTGTPRPVAIAVPDARHHLRIIGATGAGKTTLILGQLLADAEAGRGAVFIDPKGDAITDLLPRLPERLAGKVVLFDPAGRGAPPCLNVLQGSPDGTDTDVITDNITGIFRRIFAAFWGPRTDDIFRAACLTLLHSAPPGSGAVTLADIPALLGDEVNRRRVTAAVTDPVLRGFWQWYEQLSDASRAQAVGPLMNKLRAFLLRSFVRQAIAAGPSTFTMNQILDKGGLLLARLPKGVLGEETARLLGSFIVAATWQAASRRAGLPQHARPDAGLYVDECQNFLNLPYPLEDMLAEARAYRLSVVMAHQNLAQLPPDLREGISANARSQAIFTASPEDARALERHTLPHLTAHDLSHLGAYQAAAKLVAASAETPAFTLRTQPLPPAVPGRGRLIRRAARAAYSPPAAPAPAGPPAAGPAGSPAGGDPRRHLPPAA